MAKTDFKSVDEYIAAQPEAARGTLEEARAAIRKAVPKADEVISYQIPAYKIDGQAVIFFSGWKEHYSLYPIAGAVIEEFKDELAPYEVNNKGTLRFPLDKKVPVGLIGRITKFRAKEASEEAKAKAAKKKKR
jgi:uncharacterized protein YdhG (YjbR/CyaY superfamily)